MSKITLCNVYNAVGEPTDLAINTLYDLLKERTPKQSISHKEMPSLFQHVKFIASKPYKEWFLILTSNNHNDKVRPVGSIYITKNNEIGVFIYKLDKHMGYGKEAVKNIVSLYSNEDIFANINPENKESINFFNKLGFKHIQNTYKLSS